MATAELTMQDVDFTIESSNVNDEFTVDTVEALEKVFAREMDETDCLIYWTTEGEA